MPVSICAPMPAQRQGDLAEFLDAVLAGGVDVVQLREKGIEARQEIAVAQVFADAAARHGALFSINDRADVAYAVQPDILHLGQDDLPVEAARELLGEDILIGRSTHAASEVDERAGAVRRRLLLCRADLADADEAGAGRRRACRCSNMRCGRGRTRAAVVRDRRRRPRRTSTSC